MDIDAQFKYDTLKNEVLWTLLQKQRNVCIVKYNLLY